MLPRILITICFTFQLSTIFSQTIKTYVVRSDSELIELGNPQVIDGDLEISGVSSLQNLSNLKSVTGNFTLANLQPILDYSYPEIPSLETIGGELQIRDNVNWNWIDLVSLTEVGGILLDNNTSLMSINLERLQTLTGNIKVRNNKSLEALQLGSIINARMKSIELINNPTLYVFIPPNCEEIDYLEFVDNPEASVYEFKKLEKVNDHIVISNSFPSSINHFNALEKIGRYLRIENIPEKISIQFKKLKQIGQKEVGTANGLFIQDVRFYLIDFDELSYIFGDFEIEKNLYDAFIWFKFPKIKHLDKLRIINNNGFKNLDFLNTVTTITDSIIIKGNKSLASCAIPVICSLSEQTITNKITLENNLDCCTDIESLRNECEETCCPFSKTHVYDKCDVLIFKTDNGDCMQVLVSQNGEVSTVKVACP